MGKSILGGVLTIIGGTVFTVAFSSLLAGGSELGGIIGAIIYLSGIICSSAIYIISKKQK